jgi:TonB family protein
LVLALGTASRAQSGQADGIAALRGNICDSIPPVGTRTDTLVGWVTIEPADTVLAGWDAMLLDGLRMYFHLPPDIGVPVHNGVSHDTSRAFPDTISLAIRGEVSAELDRSGKLGRPTLDVSTLSRAIDESLIAAMRNLGSAGVLPPLPPGMSGRSVRVRFDVSQSPDSGKLSKPLAVVTQPTWHIGAPVSAIPGNSPPPYPRHELKRKIEGDVLVSFVVDQDGLARPETVRVIRSDGVNFEKAVLEVLPSFRFNPATINGCPVAALVQMPFGFRIGRGSPHS